MDKQLRRMVIGQYFQELKNDDQKLKQNEE